MFRLVCNNPTNEVCEKEGGKETTHKSTSKKYTKSEYSEYTMDGSKPEMFELQPLGLRSCILFRL